MVTLNTNEMKGPLEVVRAMQRTTRSEIVRSQETHSRIVPNVWYGGEIKNIQASGCEVQKQ
jgi:hypothetical protein